MATACDINKKNASNLITNQEEIDRDIKTTDKLIIPEVDIELIESDLNNEGYTDGDVIDEKILNDSMKKLYGKKSVRMILAVKINALLNANPGIREAIEEFTEEHLGTNVRAGRISHYIGIIPSNKGESISIEIYQKLSKKDKANYIAEIGIHLPALRESTLKLIYAQTFGMVNRFAGNHGMIKKVSEKLGIHGNIGGIIAQFNTPGQLQFKDPSGAYSLITKATRNYTDQISSRINVFFENPEFMPDDFKVELYARELGKKVSDLTRVERRTAIKKNAGIKR